MGAFKLRLFFLIILSFFGTMFVYSHSVNATTILQPKESESVTKSIAGTTVTDNNVTTKKPVDVQPDTNTFYHDKSIWVIGDSLAVGWDGQRNVAKNYPILVGEKLEPSVLQASYASSGSQISGNQNGTPTYDMSNNVQRVINDQQFSDANILIIELGVNDLNYSSNNLGYVQQRLQSNIKRLRKANPKIKIFGILPFASYKENKVSRYSMNDLQMALTKVYKSFGIPVLNWENTHISHGPAALGDHLVHPTQATYEKMANTISNWLLEDSNLNVVEHDSTATFVSNGWQVDEQGNRQYAENNTLVSGFKNINGKTYYFDPTTKGLLKNQFIISNRQKYYVDSDGSVIKSPATNGKDIQIINGKAYKTNHLGKITLSTKTGYLSTSQGWLWIENGQLYTGFRKYMGAFYYFENGVRQENKWVSEWGHQYFVGKDGRSVEGTNVNINGKKYNFGNNHTFYLR
ncbi:GDSL-type esterase/lipase family protein [Weissella paramesenteroides]|uniref:GDSL-type esterase/lipase family protein n=1 Tax=Weissella paramesenteroides TaxID=1249 RepID=UPI00388F4209